MKAEVWGRTGDVDAMVTYLGQRLDKQDMGRLFTVLKDHIYPNRRLNRIDPNAVRHNRKQINQLIKYMYEYRSNKGRSMSAGFLRELVEELVGNLHDPTPLLNPEWLSPTVLALVRAIRAEVKVLLAQKAGHAQPIEDHLMLILGDALEESGCADERILTHCRQTGRAHLCDCWVLRLFPSESKQDELLS